MAIVLTPSVFAVNLVVSGFPAPFTAANGVYIPTAQVNSHDCWVHSSGGYYIYFHPTCNDWEIYNVNTENICSGTSNYYAYSSNTPSPAGISWTRNSNLMTAGSISVTEESALPFPEIEISGSGNLIADGNTWTSFSNHTKFATTNISTGTATRTYTIYNNGTDVLTITNPVVISGTNAADFAITTPPATSVATGSSTTLTVTFNPSAVGIRTATITITNSDASEGTYDFAIDGYGFSPQDLVVTGIITPAAANTTYIHQGVLNNYEYWLSSNGYYLYTDGNNWFIDNNIVSTIADGVDFFSNCSFNPSILDATNWSGAPADGTRGTGTPVISAAAPTSNINVKGNSINIAINDNTPSFSDYTKYGSVNISAGSRARTYTIENTGGAALTLSGITFGGAGAADFSVTTPPPASVAAFSSTTFAVTFDPGTEGTKTATLSIPSNDPDENPYLFYISGDAFSQKNLLVSGITTPAAANGAYTYQGILNEFQYWKHATLNYYIYNSIYSNTNYWYIDEDLVSVGVSDFLFGKNSESVAPVGLNGWILGTGATGVPVIVYASPEMDVAGNSTSIVDGDVSPSTADYTDFGVTNVPSGTISRTFTIYNTGNEILNLSGTPIIVKSGTNAADFTITQPSSASLAALTGSITFTVEFNPSGAGLRTSELSIANNDSDENPYNFSIQGTGVDIPTVITSAASSITSTAATLGGNVTADGGATVSEHGVVYSLTDATPTIAEGATKLAIGSGGTGIFNQSVAPLTSNTLYYYNAYAINTAGTSYGNPGSFTTATPAITFSSAGSIGPESVSSANLPVDLSAVSGIPVTVDYTVTGTATGSGTDYTLANGTLTISAGTTGNDITIAGIVDDLLDEADETIIVTLSNPVNATLGTNTVHTYTITDNDETPSVAFTSAISIGLESVSSADLHIDLSAVSSMDVTVDYTVTGTASGSGIDYTLANGTLTITAGNTSNDITIAGIVDDLLDEADETIIVTLSNPVNATLGTNTVHYYTITDNDETPSIAFTSAISNGLESVSSADLHIDLSAASSMDVTVDYTVSGTATGSGTDYTLANGTLTISAGTTGNDITIAGIVDDLLEEGDETVIVTLSNPVNATLGTNTDHTYVIIDDDDVTAVFDISKSNISVYPNPVTDNIHFENISGDIACIIISDLAGKTVFKADYKGEKEINAAYLTPGVYVLCFVNYQGEKQMIKIVKE